MSLPITVRRTLVASALTALAIGTATTAPSLGATSESMGALRVQPSPSVAGHITVDSVTRNQSAIVDLPLTAGEHRVCLSAVPGYLPPPCESVEVVEGSTTAIAPAYSRSGVLVATTEPSQSATISIDGTARDSGEVEIPLAVGMHEVCFAAVTGMATPPCEEVDIVADGTSHVVGRYAAVTPDADPEPEEPSDPDASVTATSFSVGLTGDAASSGGNKPWSAEVTVAVARTDGPPLVGATVAGTWTTSRPATTVTSSCVTGDDGTCRVAVRGMSTGSGNSVTFTVDDVTGTDVRTGHRSVTVNRNGSVTTAE